MSVKILEYRNGIYQGQVHNNKRSGFGILITDDGQILAGQWKNDQLFGQALVFPNSQEYGFGEFNRGDLEGPFFFRTQHKTFFAEFNLSRPINKMLLINYETKRQQIIAHKTPIFNVIQDQALPDKPEEHQILSSTLNIKFECPTIQTIIKQFLCKQGGFEMKQMHNGNNLVCYNHKSDPHSLGFTLNKNGQLIAYGMYVKDKLHGLGCKYENIIRYEGKFENGFLNGKGLKQEQFKLVFGEFQNGNFTDSLSTDNRASQGEAKLKEFKRAEHLKSVWYYNAYVRKGALKFCGTQKLFFENDSQQEYIYPQISTSSPKKGKINTNLASQINKRNDFETKSSKSLFMRPTQQKNPEDYEDNYSQYNQSPSWLDYSRKPKR